MKFAIVSSDKAQLESLRARFLNRFNIEAEVSILESALYALTEFERDEPTLIVSGKDAGDMSGVEFLEIVREDLSLTTIPFILLDTDAKTSTTPVEIDRVLDTDANSAEVLRATFDLLTSTGVYSDLRSGSRVMRRQSTGSSSAIKASGTLEVLTLFDLVLSLSQGGKSGTLFVLLDTSEVRMFFEKGLVIGGMIENLTGEAAIVESFRRANDLPSAEFFFEAASEPFHSSFHTMKLPINELLLKVAVALDHHRAHAEAQVTKGQQ